MQECERLVAAAESVVVTARTSPHSRLLQEANTVSTDTKHYLPCNLATLLPTSVISKSNFTLYLYIFTFDFLVFSYRFVIYLLLCLYVTIRRYHSFSLTVFKIVDYGFCIYVNQNYDEKKVCFIHNLIYITVKVAYKKVQCSP